MNQRCAVGASGAPFVGTISPAGSRNRFLAAIRRVALINATLQDHSFSPRAIKRVVSADVDVDVLLPQRGSGDRRVRAWPIRHFQRQTESSSVGCFSGLSNFRT